MKSKQQQQPQCDGGGQVLNPPTDEEIRQFIDYLNGGVINDQRLEYEEERRRRRSEDEEGGDYDEATEEDETVENAEVQKRNRTASMYFYRHHYLSIIQEEEEIGGDHQAATPGSSRCGTSVFAIFCTLYQPCIIRIFTRKCTCFLHVIKN